jgi:hypothetical protein
MASTPTPAPASRAELIAQYNKDRDLRALILRDGHYDGVDIPEARMDGLDLRRSIFQEANLANASLIGVDATRAIFTKADLTGAKLARACFNDTQLNAAKLDGADFRGGTFSQGTNLRGASVTGLKINQRTLRMLNSERGGMSEAHQAELHVYDDQAKLLSHFGGFWNTLQLIGLALFVLPYVLFVLRKLIAEKAVPCDKDCTSLGHAMWTYIATGGTGVHYDVFALVTFLLLLIYNVFRGTLVFKASTLKLASETSGVPVDYVPSGYWWIAYQGARALVWVNLALALWHLIDLFMIPVHA